LDYISLSKEADEKIDLGKYQEAKTFLEKGLSLAKKNRNKSFIEFFLGELENIDGNYELAIPHHKKAVELAKKIEFKAFFLKNLGVTLSLLGREEEAIERFDRSLEIKPDDYDSLKSKGVSLSNLEREKEATELYDRALEIKPDDYNSLRQKGISLNNLGREKEAIELYDRALEIKPDDWLSLISKAFALESIGKNEDATRIFDFIASNKDRVKDEEIIQIVNFKKNALKEKKLDKKTYVLNEVINAFQEKKDDFFKNINDIESKFKKFVDSERSIPEDFSSFLSVLRKWNSYTPILPSEKGDNKGGEYFLYHRGKGIVIDPGFNFIENFYQEGFKVADIDAVLITHAYNDHTVDLESILTLVYKHNDAIKDTVKEEMKGKKKAKIDQEVEKKLKSKGKKIDLFMNLGTFMKYSGWLNLKDSSEINSVTVLMPNTKYEL
jgi:tetratricopeptide (TPR) repeat protein